MKFAFYSHGITKVTAHKLAELAGKIQKTCKVLFVTTPANIYPGNPKWMIETIRQLESFGFNIQRFDLEDAYEKGIDIVEKVDSVDIVFISGGNVFYFLYWVEKTGFKKILEDFMLKGGIYAGESAGAVCQIGDLTPIAWLDDPRKAPEIVSMGMKLTDIIIIPHWKNPQYQEKLKKVRDYYIEKGLKPEVIKDNQAIFVDHGKIVKI